MKKAAQLAVLVLVMLAGLYSFDYVAGSGSQAGMFTGAVASIDSASDSQKELCAVEEFLGAVICISGNPKSDYGSGLGECRAKCKEEAAGTTIATSNICGNGVLEKSNNEECDWSDYYNLMKDYQKNCDDGTIVKGKYTCTESCKLAYYMPECPKNEIGSGTTGSPNIGSFVASPATITKGGQATLNWREIKNAALCDIRADGKSMADGYVFEKDFEQGTRTVKPEQTTKYTLRCWYGEREATKQATITVTETAAGSGTGSQGTAGGTSSGSAAKGLCEIKNKEDKVKVICTSGNPKSDYDSGLGECRAKCKAEAAGTTGGTQGGGGEAANLVVDLGLGRDANVVLSISNLGKKKVSNPFAVAASIKKDGVVLCTGEGTFSSSLDVTKSAAVVAYMKGSTGASCSLQEGQPYDVEGTVDSKGQIPETNENDNTKIMRLTFLAAPSEFKCTAYTAGFRTQDGKYCDASGNAVAQKAGSQACDNSFECSSNFCAAGQCVESSVLKKTFCSFGAKSLC